MFAPDQWPGYYREARGCEIVDLDGRRYVDMSTMGIGACLLGYNDPEVTAAVVDRVKAGSMCTLNYPEEVELGQLLVGHPSLGRAGAFRPDRRRGDGGCRAHCPAPAPAATWSPSAATTAGTTGIWRPTAHRGRTAIRCRRTFCPACRPTACRRSWPAPPCPLATIRSTRWPKIVEQQGTRLAAVVMEPTRHHDPAPGFLEGVRELCDRVGAVLVFDEISIGWRLTLGGAHLRFGVQPDVAVFAKAMGNGHPMAAIIGRADVMQAAQESFISSTYWTEGVGPAAALATVRKMQRSRRAGAHGGDRHPIPRGAAADCRPSRRAAERLSGYPAMTYFGFDHPEALALQTLLTVRMLRHGFLAGAAFYPSLAHTAEHVDRYLAAAEEVFAELGRPIRQGDAAAGSAGRSATAALPDWRDG